MAEQEKNPIFTGLKQIKKQNSSNISLMETISVELTKLGVLHEKDGKLFLEVDSDNNKIKVYSKDGEKTRLFLNLKRFLNPSFYVDDYVPETNNSGGGNSDDLPF